MGIFELISETEFLNGGREELIQSLRAFRRAKNHQKQAWGSNLAQKCDFWRFWNFWFFWFFWFFWSVWKFWCAAMALCLWVSVWCKDFSGLVGFDYDGLHFFTSSRPPLEKLWKVNDSFVANRAAHLLKISANIQKYTQIYKNVQKYTHKYTNIQIYINRYIYKDK